MDVYFINAIVWGAIMKDTRSGLLLVVALSSSLPAASIVHAQDAAPVMFTWAGPYLGVFGGTAKAEIEATELFSEQFGYYTLPSDPYGFDADGVIAGAQLGYDWQWSNFIAGVVAEAGYLDLSSSIEDPNSLPTGAPVTSFESHAYGALTGRAGVALDYALLYAKGGLAFLDASGSTIDICGRSFCGPATIEATGDDVLLGWTLGGGIEIALLTHWSIGTEFAYFRFEDLQVSGLSERAGFNTQDLEVDFHSGRAFVKYRW